MAHVVVAFIYGLISKPGCLGMADFMFGKLFVGLAHFDRILVCARPILKPTL
jgi:hypothetical protein